MIGCKKNVLLALVLIINVAKAQQLPLLSSYMFDRALVNPAYVGAIPYFTATTTNRAQFSGMEGSMVSNFIAIHAPVQKHNLGLGLKVMNDKTSLFQSNTFNAMASYSLRLGNGRLSAGIESGVHNQSGSLHSLARHHQNDPLINELPYKVVSIDAGTGIYYQTGNYFLGLSSYQIFSNAIISSANDTGAGERLKSHTYFLAGFIIETNSKLKLEPSLILRKTESLYPQAAMSCRVLYSEVFSSGLSYRYKDALVFMGEVNIKGNLRLALAYDIGLSALRTYHNGSYEVLISWRKKLLPPPGKKEIHPRYYIY
jgi:type IX secretion system PorP/SprF family membrane protein